MSLNDCIAVVLPCVFLVMIPLFCYFSSKATGVSDPGFSFDQIVNEYNFPGNIVSRNPELRKCSNRICKPTLTTIVESSVLTKLKKVRKERHRNPSGILFLIKEY